MAIATVLEAPCFLLAVPQSGDSNFVHGVLLLVEHDDKGSMGLLVNRPTDVAVATFLRSVQIKGARPPSGYVYHGGPVQTDRAFILHASAHQGPETRIVSEQMRLSYSLETLQILADDAPPQLRVYLGYAGWGPHQLAAELSAGAWMVAPVDAAMVFAASCDNLWDRAVRGLGIEPGQLVHSGARN